MPIYEYRCENGHSFDAFQSMSEDALEQCEVCDAPAQRVLSAPAVHFKGSGFYTTDYARKAGSGSESGSKDSGDGEKPGGDSKGESKGTEKKKSGSGSKAPSTAGSSSSSPGD